jgi:uracil-DNA glycosylase
MLIVAVICVRCCLQASAPVVPQFSNHAQFCDALLATTGDPLETHGGRVVVYRGNPAAKLMVIGEAPGATEDATGKPFVGRSGQVSTGVTFCTSCLISDRKTDAARFVRACIACSQLLDSILKAVDFDAETDIYVTNIVKRRPPLNRDPTVAEILYYKPWLLEEIRLVKPAIVITTGRYIRLELETMMKYVVCLTYTSVMRCTQW